MNLSSMSLAALAAMKLVPSVVPAFKRLAPKAPPLPPAVTLFGPGLLAGGVFGFGGTVLERL